MKAAVGTTRFGGVTYSTTAETLTGVMVVGTSGVNHSERRSMPSPDQHPDPSRL